MSHPRKKELSCEESEALKEAIFKSKSSRVVRRLQAVLFRSQDLSKEAIAGLLNYSTSHIQQIWSQYFKHGIESLLSKEHGGRRRYNLEISEEIALLEKYKRPSGEGNILEIDGIHRELCNIVGKEVSKSSAYRLVKRHGWRKLEPRPRHPKSNEKSSYFFKAFFPSVSTRGKDESG